MSSHDRAIRRITHATATRAAEWPDPYMAVAWARAAMHAIDLDTVDYRFAVTRPSHIGQRATVRITHRSSGKVWAASRVIAA